MLSSYGMLYTMSREPTDTRGRILDAAWQLLEASRGTGVRMSDIAKQAQISRQALYLHFATRSELLIATTRYLDEVKDIDQRLAASRSAQSGVTRLEAFIEGWGNYIPEIYGIARALLIARETDDAAKQAWNDRMAAVREGCAAAVDALKRDDALTSAYPANQATDILWTMLSVRNWEQLTIECGWSQAKYIRSMKRLAKNALLAQTEGPRSN